MYNNNTGFGSNNRNVNSNANSLQFYTMSKLKNDEGGDEMNSIMGIGGNNGYSSGVSGNNNIFNNLNHSNYNYNASEIDQGNISQISNPNYVNNHHHNQNFSSPSSLTFNPSPSCTNNNVPRKSPFNINEVNNQNDGGRNELNIGGMMATMQGESGNYFNQISSGGFGNVPLGPMSSTQYSQNVNSRTQIGNGISTGESMNPIMNLQQGGKASSFSSLTSLIRLLNPSLLWSAGQVNSSSSSDYRNTQQGGTEDDYDDILNEPPLLEELGIDPANIAKYLKCVIMFKSIKEYSGNNISMKGDEINNNQIEWDMAGPILLIGCLGFFLLLAGKIHFGYIYGIGILSCIGTYILLNIMSNSQSIDLYTTMSILGYSLLPIVILAGISVIFSLRTKVGIIMAIFFNMWSTITASRFFEYTVSLKHQRYLIAYPIALLYASFTIVTIF